MQEPYEYFYLEAIYALLTTHEILRMLLSYAANKIILECADVNISYLYSHIYILIIMEQSKNSTKELENRDRFHVLVMSL